MDEPPPPRRFRGLKLQRVGGIEVPVAEKLAIRLIGLALLPAERAGRGLLIPRCRSVHTFGMRFALDITFLDCADRAIEVHAAVSPCRVVACRGAGSVLEVVAGRRLQ